MFLSIVIDQNYNNMTYRFFDISFRENVKGAFY